MGNARRSSSAAPSRQERCFMNSITTRVWIAGASGRLGSALSHRFGGNTAYKLVTSDRDVAVSYTHLDVYKRQVYACRGTSSADAKKRLLASMVDSVRFTQCVPLEK